MRSNRLMASSILAFVPCIPSFSLLTHDVGGVFDSFTWGQGEEIPGDEVSLRTHDFHVARKDLQSSEAKFTLITDK